MWSYTDDYSIIANLYIRSKFKDGVLQFYQIYPCDGYVLRIPANDEYERDEEGNYVLDENGNRILIMEYRSCGGAMEFTDYDWSTNPCGYCAELYEEGMEVFGRPEDNNHEVM